MLRTVKSERGHYKKDRNFGLLILFTGVWGCMKREYEVFRRFGV
jgi:hypothetical protein